MLVFRADKALNTNIVHRRLAQFRNPILYGEYKERISITLELL